MYSTLTNESVPAGSFAARVSSLAAVIAVASCLARAADFGSCASALIDPAETRRATSVALTRALIHTSLRTAALMTLVVALRRGIFNGILDEQRVFVVGPALPAGAVRAHDFEGRAKACHERRHFASRPHDGGLDRLECLLDARGEHPEQTIDAFDLRGGQRGGARGVAADRLQMVKDGLRFL